MKDQLQDNNLRLENIIKDIKSIPSPDALPQTKTVTPTTEAQIVKPDTGYILTQVDIEAIPDDYIIPSASPYITENGVYDATTWKRVSVAVEGEVMNGGFTISEILHKDKTISTYQLDLSGDYIGAMILGSVDYSLMSMSYMYYTYWTIKRSMVSGQLTYTETFYTNVTDENSCLIEDLGNRLISITSQNDLYIVPIKYAS